MDNPGSPEGADDPDRASSSEPEDGFTSATAHLVEAEESPLAPRSDAVLDESPLRTIGVAVGLGFLGVMAPLVIIGVLVSIILVTDPPGRPVFVGILIVGQFALFVVVGIGYLRWRGFDRRRIIEYIGIDMPSLRDLGLILVTWVVMIVATAIAAGIVTTVIPELLGVAEDTTPAANPAATALEDNPELILVGILGMFLVVGPAEEILFRGVIQNRLRERMGVIPAILIASVVFAVAHVIALAGQDPVGIAMTLSILFVPSLGLGAIYEYTDNIVVPSILHGFHNSVILLSIYIATTAEMTTVWLAALAVLPV